MCIIAGGDIRGSQDYPPDAIFSMESLKNEVQEQYEVGIVEFVYIYKYIYIIYRYIFIIEYIFSMESLKNEVQEQYEVGIVEFVKSLFLSIFIYI